MAKRNDFIKDLVKFKRDFLKYAKANSVRVHQNTFEINPREGYLTFRVEAEDTSGDTIAFYQELDMERDSQVIYQQALLKGSISTYY